MARDIMLFVNSCFTCQEIRNDRVTKKLPLTSLKIRDILEATHLDFHECRVRDAKHGNKYILIMTDSVSLHT